MRRAGVGVLLVATACGVDRTEEPVEWVEVLDSAGVEVVVSHHPDTVLVLEEVVRTGLLEGDPRYEFHQIRSVAAGPQGSFWLVDGHEAVRHFNADGEYLASVGGRGRGPGEAEGYVDAVVGESGVVVLGYPSTLQEFATDGTLQVSRSAATGDGAYVRPMGFAHGQWVLRLERTPPNRDPVFRTAVEIATARTLSDRFEPVLAAPGQLRHAGRGRGPFFHGDPSVAVAAAGHIFVSDTLEYRIDQYRLDGTLVRVIRRSVEPRPYDADVINEVEEGSELLLRYGQRGDRDPDLPINRDVLRQMVSDATPTDPPDHLPFIDDLLASPEGVLWVARADRHPRPGMRAVAHASGYVRWAWRPEWAAEREFDVFSPDGRYIGTTSFPPEYAPMAVTEDRVYGVWYDELGVEQVVVYTWGG